MSNVRYYDYGVMRREADRRMYDVQRRSCAESSGIKKQPEQTRPESETQPYETRDVINVDEKICCEQEQKECRAAHGSPLTSLSPEELLIVALLLLTLSEGRNLPLMLVLLYLLM